MMFKEKLLKYCQNITPEQLSMMEEYYILLSEHSKLYNLTAIKDEDEVIVKHFYDSLMFYDALGIGNDEKLTVIDMGCGAGFPGLVAAIMNGNCHFTLVDSVGKKIKFVQLVADQLGLKNITTIHARSEILGQDLNYREQFDIGVARSLAYLPVLSEYLIPFIKVEGKMIVTKEYPIDEELLASKRALSILGAKLIREDPYDLPVYHNKRVFLTFQKFKLTPLEYPRREGIPSRKSI